MISCLTSSVRAVALSQSCLNVSMRNINIKVTSVLMTESRRFNRLMKAAILHISLKKTYLLLLCFLFLNYQYTVRGTLKSF